MKVAVIMTGFLRTYENMFYFLEKNILNKYDCDLFCITWEQQENYQNVDLSCFRIYEKYLKNFKIESNKIYYDNKKPFAPLDRNHDVFKTDQRAIYHGTYWANRLIDQWKLVYEGYKLIENIDKYDIVIRLRYDTRIESIDIKKINALVIPKDVGGWSFTDHMAYSNPNIMKIYCDLYNHIENLYIEHNIDITHAVDMPKFYINNNNIEYIIDDKISYQIIK